MNQLRKIVLGCAVIGAVMGLIGCNGAPNQGSSAGLGMASLLSSYPAGTNNMRLSLTDAPSRDLEQVFVNVDHAELFVKKGGKEARLIVAQDLGLIDLLQLKNGVMLPMHDLTLPTGLEITGIRLVLKGTDNHSIKKDGSRCEMQTPSGQESGIKIHLASPFTLEENYTYSMVLDFDAGKSVVVKGNGDCLLKPVLKLMQVTRRVVEVAPPVAAIPDPSSTTGGSIPAPGSIGVPAHIVDQPVTSGTDTNVIQVVDTTTTAGTTAPSTTTPTTTAPAPTGFDTTTPATSLPPVISIDASFLLG